MRRWRQQKESEQFLTDWAYSPKRIVIYFVTVLIIAVCLHVRREKNDKKKVIYPDGRRFLIILWRRKPMEPNLDFCNIWWIWHLSISPRALPHFDYVNDCLTGGHPVKDVINGNQIINLLAEARFILRKWCPNHPSLQADISKDDQEINLYFTDFTEKKFKTLGLQGRAETEDIGIVTKRIMCSKLAKIFDSLV